VEGKGSLTKSIMLGDVFYFYTLDLGFLLLYKYSDAWVVPWGENGQYIDLGRDHIAA